MKGDADPRSLGSYEYKKYGNRYHVEVFLFDVQEQLNDWPEAHRRRRKWVTAAKAMALVDEPELRDLFAKAARRLGRAAARTICSE